MNKSPTVIVLAEDVCERMAKPNCTACGAGSILGGKSLIQHTLDRAMASGLVCHLEQSVHSDIGWAIASGVAATPDAQGWIIVPGNLPLINEGTLLLVAQQLKCHSVVTPTHLDVRSSVFGFARVCKEDLLSLSNGHTLMDMLKRHKVTHIPVNDSGVVNSINNESDLARAESLYISMQHWTAAIPMV